MTWYVALLAFWWKGKVKSGRDCPEQSLILRLIIDTVRKLSVLFIDYVKTYDMLDENVLLELLASQGWGPRFPKAVGPAVGPAVGRSLQNTCNVIGQEKFKSSTGIKQGSSFSCGLFAFYLDHTIRSVKSYGDDGYLGNTHLLLLMDGTVHLATSRQAMMAKLTSLNTRVQPR